MPRRRHLSGPEYDELILDAHRRSVVPSDIAHDLAVTVGFVRERLVASGIVLDERGQASVHPMWGHDLDDRRRAIWQRQRDGARQTRRELARQVS